MRRALWCWLAAILCAGMEALARSSSPRGKEPPDHTPPVLKYCGDDLKRLCPDSSKVFELYCLYENKNQLSDACRDYLGSTTMGGCNDEAMALCNDYESVPDITSCLYNHSQSLSEDCLRNLQNSKEVTNPLVEEQEQFLHATMASALISFVALSLPLLAFLWALHMWYNLYLEQRRVLRAPREYIKAHSEVLQLIRACDRILSAQSADSSASPAASSEADHSWTLSFRSISFWTEERDPVLPFVSMDKQERKQILHEVSSTSILLSSSLSVAPVTCVSIRSLTFLLILCVMRDRSRESAGRRPLLRLWGHPVRGRRPCSSSWEGRLTTASTRGIEPSTGTYSNSASTTK